MPPLSNADVPSPRRTAHREQNPTSHASRDNTPPTPVRPETKGYREDDVYSRVEAVEVDNALLRKQLLELQGRIPVRNNTLHFSKFKIDLNVLSRINWQIM